ncbi:MAG: FkbM family methyltransferase [Sulfolobales archaeon]
MSMQHHNGEEITIDVILKHVSEAFELVKQREIEGFIRSYNSSMMRSIAGFLVRRFISKLGYSIEELRGSTYRITAGEKSWSIDFLSYILQSRHLSFSLKIFEDSQSICEVKKFVRNKVYCALLDQAPRNILFDKEDIKYSQLYREMWRSIKKSSNTYVLSLRGSRYVLPINHFEPTVFIHEMGLRDLPSDVIWRINDRDVIDAGAFIGDSVLIFEKYKPRKVYVFEPIKENVSLLKKTLQLNNIDNVSIIEAAVGELEGSVKMFFSGSASLVSEQADRAVDVVTIDRVFKDKGDIAAIKMDVEGYELPAVKGACKTIKKHKPILLISLYHRGRDFFEIPTLIKSWVPEYKIKFVNLNHASPILERLLVAWV